MFESRTGAVPLNAREIGRARLRKHPLVVLAACSDSRGAHFVVISGYCRTATEFYVFVCDPRTGDRVKYTIEQLRTNFQSDGTWHTTYLTKGDGDATVPQEIC